MAVHRGRGRSRRIALAFLLVAGAASAQALSLGQSDSFSAGLAGWGSGPGHPQPPEVVAGGGPAGAADAYLRVVSLGGLGGPGSRLVLIAGDAWDGNYGAAGITALRLDLNNLGPSDLALRLWFEGPGGPVFSTDAYSLPSGSGWTSHHFSLAPGALTGLNVATTMAGVTGLRLAHAPAIVFPPDTVVGRLGVDNVTAVPEPGTAALLLAGAMGLWAWRRPRNA